MSDKANAQDDSAAHSAHHSTPASGPVVTAILVVALAYAGAVAMGLPQKGTALVAAAAEHAAHGEAHNMGHGAPHADSDESQADRAASSGGAASGDAPAGGETAAGAAPPVWTVIPFVLLLGAIATFPLMPGVQHWWESNLHRGLLAAGLGLVTVLYYAVLHQGPLEGHWPAHHEVLRGASGFDLGFARSVLENAILQEYIPFIVLLFSLFTICGGIRIEGDLQANPMTNALFMAAGAVLASFIGTTGAAMLLVRPLLETNRERKFVAHTVVFFTFIVCNCGGCLLPIGDPPLFLGYLAGVPFTWTLGLWEPWLWTNGLLILLYLLMDEIFYYRRETEADITRDIRQVTQLTYRGLATNGPLLVGVILAVALLDPSKALPGTDWRPWMYLREVVQLGLVALSLALGSRKVREDNGFTYHAIIEVAALFIGIFICMQPALQILGERGPSLGIDTPEKFFWVTGALSSVLDNAPTYLVFFETAKSLPSSGEVVAGVDHLNLAAISLGAVFMGAMTYIGNGPNFMVKAIAESSGVKMPSFFGYMLYSFTLLLPVLVFVVWKTF